MSCVRLNGGIGHEHAPRRRCDVRLGQIIGVPVLDHRRAGSVSLEVVGVELDAIDRAATTEAHHGPVMPRSATPFRLPAIAHVCRASWHDEILTVTVVHVTAADDEAAILDRREVGLASVCE